MSNRRIVHLLPGRQTQPREFLLPDRFSSSSQRSAASRDTAARAAPPGRSISCGAATPGRCSSAPSSARLPSRSRRARRRPAATRAAAGHGSPSSARATLTDDGPPSPADHRHRGSRLRSVFPAESACRWRSISARTNEAIDTPAAMRVGVQSHPLPRPSGLRKQAGPASPIRDNVGSEPSLQPSLGA